MLVLFVSFDRSSAEFGGLDGPAPFPNQTGCYPSGASVSKIIFVAYILLIFCETCESLPSYQGPVFANSNVKAS